MDASCSSQQEKEDPTLPKRKEKKDCKQDNKERKLQFRHLSDDMLEKYRRLSEDADLNQRQYEEVAFRVCGKLPTKNLSKKPETKTRGSIANLLS